MLRGREPLAIDRDRLDAAAAGAKCDANENGKPKRRGDLRAEQARAEDPDRHAQARRPERRAPAARVARRGRSRSLPSRRAGNSSGLACSVRRKRERRGVIGAGRAAQPEIDAAGKQRCQRAELLRHLQRRVVRQHDAAGADANASTCPRRHDRSAPPWRRWRCPACCDARRARSADSPTARRAARDRACCETPAPPCRPRRSARGRGRTAAPRVLTYHA